MKFAAVRRDADRSNALLPGVIPLTDWLGAEPHNLIGPLLADDGVYGGPASEFSSDLALDAALMA